jgi:hypothetical protein
MDVFFGKKSLESCFEKVEGGFAVNFIITLKRRRVYIY